MILVKVSMLYVKFILLHEKVISAMPSYVDSLLLVFDNFWINEYKDKFHQLQLDS